MNTEQGAGTHRRLGLAFPPVARDAGAARAGEAQPAAPTAALPGAKPSWARAPISNKLIPGLGGDSAACEGFDDWYDDTNERAERLFPLMDSLREVETADPDDADALIKELNLVADEQRRSDPPPEAGALNDLYVEYFDLFADTIQARADLELTVWGEKSQQLSDTADEAEKESQRVLEACD